MGARNWLLSVLGLTAAAAGVAILAGIALDPYGLFRDPRGRQLPAYGDPRAAKYLLSQRYVPENFNALLIGSSMSANWDVRAIRRLRVYNESLNGGNSVELHAIVQQALGRPGIGVAFLIVHPYLTHSHDFETVTLEPRLRLGALGSQGLLDAYKDLGRHRLRHVREGIDYAGTETFDALPNQLNPVLRRLMRPGAPFEVDPVALASYREMIADLHRRHVQIVFLIPPLFDGLWQSKQSEFLKYARLIEADFRSGDLLLDFTSDEFADFRRDPANFADGVHMVTAAAEIVVSHIDARVDQWISQGLLQQAGPALKGSLFPAAAENGIPFRRPGPARPW